MLNIIVGLLMLSEPTTTDCVKIGDGHYACRSEGDSQLIAEAGEHITIHTYDTEATTGEGWECAGGLCTFDFGLVAEAEVPLPAQGGTTCEDAPASCDGQDGSGTSEPPPPPPFKGLIWVRRPIEPWGKP